MAVSYLRAMIIEHPASWAEHAVRAMAESANDYRTAAFWHGSGAEAELALSQAVA